MSSVEATRPKAMASISSAASIGTSPLRFRSVFARRIAIGPCFLRAESGTEEDELLRLWLSEDADESLTAAGPRHEADVHLRLPELRAFRGDPEVACDGELQAAAEAVAVDRGDRRLREIRQAAEDFLGAAGELPDLERLRDVAERRQVGAGAERPVAGPGDDDAPHVR